MIDTEKEYWFAFEPYIHITLKEKAALLYNTLDGEYIKGRRIYQSDRRGRIKIHCRPVGQEKLWGNESHRKRMAM